MSVLVILLLYSYCHFIFHLHSYLTRQYYCSLTLYLRSLPYLTYTSIKLVSARHFAIVFLLSLHISLTQLSNAPILLFTYPLLTITSILYLHKYQTFHCSSFRYSILIITSHFTYKVIEHANTGYSLIVFCLSFP